jgi:hypothetical protein
MVQEERSLPTCIMHRKNFYLPHASEVAGVEIATMKLAGNRRPFL